ncbi:LysR family transcriptional regulator [Streptomyces cavernae]|uniref:LysR family transcriptional regulator n=1 Tax=Streptomyces cavernae TaxID=2259034 RepID=UPI000FEC10FC|nr:LysR family transcriptional regulator [Streptomyces cavernae]
MVQDGGTNGSSPPSASGGQNDPSIHQLRVFLVLAEELHFGRAAARLHVTQPALSQQLRALETRLGVTLIDRTSRAISLTAAGGALLPEAEEIVAGMARLHRRVGARAREVRGHLVIGFIAGEVAMPYTHAILGALHDHHPGISVDLLALGFANQIEALTCGDVDAAFLRPPLPSGLQSLQLATEPRVACLPAGHRLATDTPIALEQLDDHLVVDIPAQMPRIWWDHWTVNPRPDGAPVRFGPVAHDIESMLHLVGRGRGMSFLPAAARRLYPRPGVAYVDVTGLPLTTAALTWLPGNRDRPTVAALRTTAQRVLRDAAGQLRQ